MGIKKTTHLEDYRLVHVWDDPEVGFHAEVTKKEGRWVSSEGRAHDFYRDAVDELMDEWRRAKAEALESRAVELALDQGYSWVVLDDYTQQDYINAARARVGL